MAGRLRVIGADRLTTAGNMSVSTSSAACSSSCRLSMGNARKSKSIRSIKRKSKINVRNSICISSGKRGVQSDPHICRGLVNVRPIDSGSGSCYHYFKRTNRFLIQPASSIVYNRKLSTMATTSQVEVKVNVDMEHIDLENIKRAAAVVVAEKSITPSIDSDEVGAQENSDQIYEFVKSGSVGEEDNNVIHSNTESLSVSEPPKRRKRRSVKTEKATYLLSAVAMSTLVTGLAFVCTYSRFTRHLGAGEHLPWFEINGTLLFIVGAAFAMELWALWAHRVLWHEGSLWKLHESHHKPRTGPFEANDLFAIINAAPAIALIAYGFFNDGLIPGLCYGAGLGITCFGMLYMFVHDGLVHRRFPVGPIGEVPYLKKVAAAHQIHHTDQFKGVPYGLFLGPWELNQEKGGTEAMEKILEVKKEKERRLGKGN